MTDPQNEQRTRVLQKLRRELGAEVMAALLHPATTEICLNTDGLLWVEKIGQPMHVVGKMTRANADAMMATLAASLDTVVNAESPILEGELPIDGSRFEGLISPVVPFPVFSIRKKAVQIFTLEDYVTQGIMSDDQRLFLRHAIAERKNILVVGGTGSGKTTLTNALVHALSEITPDHRLIMCEDTPELQCAAKNVVFLRTSRNVTMQTLLRVCMRLRPDRILVGEVRGGEALDLLKGWNTGHPGGISTVHANSAVLGLTRLEQLIAEVSKTPMETLIGESVNILVGISKEKGSRRVRSIVTVKGYDTTARKYITEEMDLVPAGGVTVFPRTRISAVASSVTPLVRVS